MKTKPKLEKRLLKFVEAATNSIIFKEGFSKKDEELVKEGKKLMVELAKLMET